MRQTGCNLRQASILHDLMISNPPPSSVDHLVQHCLPRIAKALTPIAFVQCILAAYTKYGIDPTQALAEAQITPDQLANSEARITAGQMEKISGAAMRQLDDEGLGWFSRRLPWGSYGMMLPSDNGSPARTKSLSCTRMCLDSATRYFLTSPSREVMMISRLPRLMPP